MAGKIVQHDQSFFTTRFQCIQIDKSLHYIYKKLKLKLVGDISVDRLRLVSGKSVKLLFSALGGRMSIYQKKLLK